MQSKILDYLDIEKANILLDGFNKSTGFVTAILNLEGNVLSQSGWRKICTDFHRKHPESARNCTLSDTILSNEMHYPEKFHFYQCMNGLIDVRVPIVVRGEHIANLFSGQFFFERPEHANFMQQAQHFGYDASAYMCALNEVPVFTRAHVETAMNFLLSITELIIEMTAEKLDQFELMQSIKLSEAALLESQNQLNQNMHDLLESQRIAKFGTWRLDVETRNIVWSNEMYRIFDLDPMSPPPSLEDQERFFTPESWLRLMRALEKAITQGLPYELELATINKHGLTTYLWVRASASKDVNGKVSTINGSAQDITERKMNEERLYFLSYHDHLTGLHNRRYFEDALIRLDCEEMLPLSIIMCDVNGLKIVNDSFGHSEGDELLKKAANIIKKVCRDEDVVARIGGDEFVVMLTKTSNEEALRKSNEIKALASKESIANIELSISFGYETKTHAEQSLIAIISNAENYMYRHKLYERSSLRSKNIDLILNALFEKSKREELHSTRVGNICKAIAIQMNLDTVTVNKLCVAGRVHDIGKIGIDENILNKPSSLTQHEMNEVRNHPEIGWRLLSSTNEFSELAQFILNHHEWWDGTGYPNGLKQNEIPIESRIIAIADAFDAMTRDRCYHKALSLEETTHELSRCAGTQFDPDIVAVFLNKVVTEDSTFFDD